ncbi:bifunctional DNA primase/polymerase [Roseomonas gilardii]|uniref:Bifunctional DNA primase/polymerase n=1 Tax=Roseomonas gilardii TaxID=257708 RepID=A0ABU3MKX4_9PROT|nr:bifunctional DNA primase/polymerase [Roseomonas gilardii]MDT8333014.1 bifunctional DNA primase/polymerase [Roseomonas gilardii]
MSLHPDIERVALLGWRCVPAARSKKGLWKGFLDSATHDLEQLDRWSHEFPGCCWKVIPSGSGIWALDADVPGPEHAADGEAEMRRMVEENGPLPPRPHGRSGGGGHLLVFRDEGHPIRCKSGWPRPGLDPRAKRCAFTISPSRSYAGPYRWAVAPWDVAPPVAPDWLLKAVAPPPEKPRPPVPFVPTTDAAMRALDRACGRLASAAPGTRNDSLNAAAFTAGRWVGAGLLHEVEAAAMLFQTARAVGQGEKEARDTIRSGLMAGAQRPMEARNL